MKTVLIVDDAMFMRSSLKQMLNGSDYEVIGEASNGEEAIEAYIKLSPDIVTMDITMPVMDGVTAVKEIIKLDENANVIMISAMGQQVMVLETINAGAKNFIIKPFAKEKVMQVFDTI
ncbi:response regulator [Clostridiaceae bacterium HSG29]|nr:response regulator [Clostridiaceae bacterium HSG29]